MLVDEPVSSLDPTRAEAMIRLLVRLAREDKRSLVASMHAVPLALRYFDRVIALREGVVWFDRAVSEVDEKDLAALYSIESDGGEPASDGDEQRETAVGRPPEAR